MMVDELTFMVLAPSSMAVPLKRLTALAASPGRLNVTETIPVDWPLLLKLAWHLEIGPISWPK